MYSGILEIATSDDEIAAVLGQELAHVLASHNNESDMYDTICAAISLPLMPLLAFGYHVNGPIGRPFRDLAMMIRSFLPSGWEGEADRIGQLLMADAGYDPIACATILKKLSKVDKEALEKWIKEGWNSELASRLLDMHPDVTLPILITCA